MLLAEIDAGPPPPGFIAYLAGLPVGWCGVSVRGATPRLDHSRVIPAIDDRPVWAIGCFQDPGRLPPAGRGQGPAWRRSSRPPGRPARRASKPIRSIPVGRRIDTAFAYVGIASMFDAAGFRRVVLTDARSAGLPRWLVRLDFEDRRG